MKRLGQARTLAARLAHASGLTPLGWCALVGGIAFACLGWPLGWLEYRSLAFLAALLLVVAALWTLRRIDHDVALELHSSRVQAGTPGLGRIWFRGQAGGSPALTAELPVGRAVARFPVVALGDGESHEELFSIPTRRRGVIAVGPVRGIQADPVGLIRRTKQLAPAQELFIHPKIVPVEPGAIGFLKDVEGITTANLSSSDVSFHALREYIPGDDRRSVHWRTTARVGKLMVRQFEETMRAHLLLLLATRRADYASDDDFETAVSTAASLGVAALSEERQVTLYTSTGQVPFPGTTGLLDELSRVELADGGLELRELALQAHRETSGISVTGFVTGAADLLELRSAQLMLPPEIRTFGVRVAAELKVTRRQVGDFAVVDVPELEALPRAVGSLT